MTIIAIIAVVIIVGMVLLLRSPPPAPKPVLSDADTAALRNAVVTRLQQRLVGWTIDTPADKPFVVIATEAGTERRINMDLHQLSESWFPLFSQHRTDDAEELVESFAAGVTGQGEGSDEAVDASELRDLLALRLVTADRVPPVGLAKPVGDLRAVLVRRDRGGGDLVTAEDLATMNLSTDEAFAAALENLKRDVEEGIEVDHLDDGDPPGAIAIAPQDPLAASYALVPGLAAKVRKVIKRDAKLYVDAESLVAAVDGVELERDRPLVAEAIALDALAWR